MTVFHYYYFLNIAGLLYSPQSQWHISHLADILINIGFFSEQDTTVIFVRVSWHSNVISMDIAVCSCRNKTNIKPTNSSRAPSGMERPWHLSSVSVHASRPQLRFGKTSQEASICFLRWWCLPDVEQGFWTFQDGKTVSDQVRLEGWRSTSRQFLNF